MVLLLYGSLRYYFISKSTVETVLFAFWKTLTRQRLCDVRSDNSI